MKARFIDLTNQRFDKLIVISDAGTNAHGSRTWLCKCDCQNEKTINGDHLRGGKITSCGCYQSDFTKERHRNYFIKCA